MSNKHTRKSEIRRRRQRREKNIKRSIHEAIKKSQDSRESS